MDKSHLPMFAKPPARKDIPERPSKLVAVRPISVPLEFRQYEAARDGLDRVERATPAYLSRHNLVSVDRVADGISTVVLAVTMDQRTVPLLITPMGWMPLAFLSSTRPRPVSEDRSGRKIECRYSIEGGSDASGHLRLSDRDKKKIVACILKFTIGSRTYPYNSSLLPR